MRPTSSPQFIPDTLQQGTKRSILQVAPAMSIINFFESIGRGKPTGEMMSGRRGWRHNLDAMFLTNIEKISAPASI
jgi:hypothetical protein